MFCSLLSALPVRAQSGSFRGYRAACLLGFWLATAQVGHAALVALNPDTAAATFSQSDFSVREAVDNVIMVGSPANNGWALSPNIGNQVAVFESFADFGFENGTNLTFTLSQVFGGEHTLGYFRLSITTDDRSLFADGQASGGDVTANWSALNPTSLSSASGATLTEQADDWILASGLSPLIDVYTITALTSLTGITGVRLEVAEISDLPLDGPGRQPTNGNFVLSELQVMAEPTPEPGTLCLWAGLGVIVAGRTLKRRSWAIKLTALRIPN